MFQGKSEREIQEKARKEMLWKHASKDTTFRHRKNDKTSIHP